MQVMWLANLIVAFGSCVWDEFLLQQRILYAYERLWVKNTTTDASHSWNALYQNVFNVYNVL